MAAAVLGGGACSPDTVDVTDGTESSSTADPTTTTIGTTEDSGSEESGSESECGNGIVEPGEACDDGNDDNADACLDICEEAYCGDGYVGPGEGCDDGNDNDVDECSNACILTSCGDGVVQAGEACDDANSDETDACLSSCLAAACGDGFVWAGEEECDDANADSTDACTELCAAASCGDGFVWAGEESCDDGNDDDTDACVAGCQPAACGDGFVWAGEEECDDANDINTDTCIAACIAASCGDGYVGPGESCDDGNDINDDACTNSCALASCGDGMLQQGEDCDDANLDNSDACLNTCVAASCGDNFVWAGEEDCDDGNVDNTDACISTCVDASCGDSFVWAGEEDCDDGDLDNSDACIGMCVDASCGDGFVWAGQEVCDDGNLDNTDTCINTCEPASCGDGFVWAGQEACDDGDLDNTDSCTTECAAPSCVDGLVSGAETDTDCGGPCPGCDNGESCQQSSDCASQWCEMATCAEPDAIQVSVGTEFTCILLEGGSVRCWGRGGMLGYGHINNIGDNEFPSTAGNVDVGAVATKIDLGFSHACVLTEDGAVRCWGSGGNNGKLGHPGVTTIGAADVPADFGDIDVGDGVVVDVQAAAYNTCVLFDDGAVRCWGEGLGGYLGAANVETIGDDEVPAAGAFVELGAVATQISIGSRHACALLSNDSVRCWGYDAWRGTLGLGMIIYAVGDDELPSSMPTLQLGGPVEALQAALGASCVLLAGGELRCWGENDVGQLGYGNTIAIGDDEAPGAGGPVSLSDIPIALAEGGMGDHSCVLMDGGAVQCWGGLGVGYLINENVGDDETPDSLGFVDVGGVVTQLAVGGHHTCALLDDANIRCWGFGGQGRLGYGNIQDIGDDETPASAGNVPYK